MGGFPASGFSYYGTTTIHCTPSLPLTAYDVANVQFLTGPGKRIIAAR
jgi:hypothetical protein